MDKDSIESFTSELAFSASAVSAFAGMIAGAVGDKFISSAIIAVAIFFFNFWGAYEGRKFYDRHRQG